MYTNIDGNISGGMIVETEAYNGPDDRGSHAYNNKRTPRNQMMYNAGGVVYMYLCYGIHDMLNIVTCGQGSSHAVLIRAVEPFAGIETMRERRNLFIADKRLCQGPGALGKFLGLNKLHNSVDLHSSIIWMEDSGLSFSDEQIASSPRVGMNFEGVYKTIPWPFYLSGNKFVSKPHS